MLIREQCKHCKGTGHVTVDTEERAREALRRRIAEAEFRGAERFRNFDDEGKRLVRNALANNTYNVYNDIPYEEQGSEAFVRGFLEAAQSGR